MQPSDFSIHGAVDLGARKAAMERAAQRREAAAAGPGPGGGPGQAQIIDVTDDTFATEVVERSMRVPVIVDLWAEWCGPCKQLSPVLEKLATEAAGEWVLAKVDVDANPRIAQTMRAQSIPMVVAVVGGQVVHGFMGALPENEVRQWLDQLLGALREQGLMPQGGEVPEGAEAAEPEIDPAYSEAQQAIETGDLDAAAEAFKKILANAPADEAAKAGLAQVELARRIQGADPERILADAEAAPDDPRPQTRAADLEMAQGRFEAAFDRLIGVVKRTSGDERNAARVHLLSLFEMLPPGDPRVTAARRKLTSALF
ncbi:MAG: tetratricopeptide repeat protein [Streptosporangiales bacterium]|nr:tetratricopeptide repeat protein [Streptosporangiales bacterium]